MLCSIARALPPAALALLLVSACREPPAPDRRPLVLPTAPSAASAPPQAAAPATVAPPKPSAEATAAQAARYLAVFTDLAQRLRADLPYAALRRLPIYRITEPTLNAQGRQTGQGRRLDPAGWLQRLADWERAGYAIEDSTWRPVRFEPGPPARSWIAAEVRLRKADRPWVLRGTVDVTWRRTELREVRFDGVALRAGD